MANRLLALALGGLLALSLWPHAAFADTTAEEVEEDNSLASSLVTPHKPWAKGHAAGPVRALVFVYTGPYEGTWEDTGTRVRHVVELRQRFDLQADAVLFCGKGDKWVFHGQRLGEERAERLLASPYPLYIVAGFPMAKLPAKIQYLILKQVAEGAGLLCCGPGATDYMVANRLLTPTPPALVQGLPMLDGKPASQMVSAYRLRKGRGVWLKYGAQALVPTPEFTRRGLAEYDYWMLLVGRAALWAASREGDVAVSSVLGDQPFAARPGTAGEIVLTAAQPLQATVALELRRACDGAAVPLPEQKIALTPERPARVPAAIPRLRAGDYFLDVIVRSKRGVEACGAGNVTIASDFGIEKVELSRSFVERGQAIAAQVALRGEAPAGSQVRLRWRDSYDRVLKQQDWPAARNAPPPFEYVPDAFATIEMRAEAALLAGGAEVEMKDASFFVPKRRQGQFNFVMWDAGLDALGFHAWRQMQDAGYNVCLIGSMGKARKQPAVLAACDASLAPYTTRILDPKDEKGFMQPVCWNDELAAAQHVQTIVDNQKFLREQGIFVYSLGDEGVTKGCCVHPSCLAAYRRYLTAQYGAVERLNASWGAQFKSFDEVNLLDTKDNMETSAAKTCPPRWYDRQAFARYNLMQFTSRFVKAFKGLDPQALTGFEGTGGFGDDYDALIGINEFYGPYPSIGDDIIRSAASPALVNSNWMGYSKTGDALSDAAWRMVMKGKNSIWFWMWSGIGSWRGYLRPTLDLWPAITDLTEEMRPVRQGLGDLLMRSQMAHSGISVFYSLPSALSSQLEVSNQFIQAQAAHETWTQLTYEIGRDFRYLTSGMLQREALSNAEFRVLLLPMTQALSPDEAAAVRRFAENGGTVIADVRPGMFDAHCKPVTPGLLDDLFGVRRTGRGKAVESPIKLKLTLQGRALDVAFEKARLDAHVEAAAGQALASANNVPAMIVNTVGKGRAILLNFQMAIGAPEDATATAARKLLQFLYDVAEARSAIAVASPNGEPLPTTETRVWRNGDALVFGLWRQMRNAWFSPKKDTVAGEPAPARVALSAPRHVYDLRGRKHLGRVDRVDTRLRWGRASFFLAAPYQIGPLKVALSSPRAGEAVTASITLGIPAGAKERYAVWVEVTDPLGQRPLWGRQVVLLEQGRGQVQFPVAHNDAPGAWRLTATELFSSQSAAASWTVKP